MLLREMKDLKRNYRDNYDRLKNLKQEILDLQTNIDSMKQQLIIAFEQWYAAEFDLGKDGGGATLNLDESYHDRAKGQMSTYKGDSLVMTSQEEVDEDALAFNRAKKNVDQLHKAKKMDKQKPSGRH